MPVRLRIQDVTVVPMLAPMMMPTAWFNFMMPEFTNPTTMTVVAEEDCMTAVTPTPRSTAFSLFDVREDKMLSKCPPEAFERPSPTSCMP